MGGNCKFGLIAGDKSEWFISAKKIGSMYDPGSMIYSIEDPILGRKGNLGVTVLALYDREGVIIKIEGDGIPENVKLFAAYGGATGTRFSRDGDIGADPESSFDLKPAYCKDNAYKLDQQHKPRAMHSTAYAMPLHRAGKLGLPRLHRQLLLMHRPMYSDKDPVYSV